MKHDEQALHTAAVNTVAALMATAAKTAPKSCGADTLETVVLDGADKEDLADAMCELAQETSMDFYRRDAENVRRSQCVVVIGAIASYMSTAHCGLCGMGNCGTAMRNNATCAFSGINLGIALGSAVGIAAAAQRKKVFERKVTMAFGIPLSSTAKNIFYDRNSTSIAKPKFVD